MAMTFETVRHLLARSGFESNPSEIRQLAAMDRDAAVDSLLSGTRQQAITTLPPHGVKGMSVEEKRRSHRSGERKPSS